MLNSINSNLYSSRLLSYLIYYCYHFSNRLLKKSVEMELLENIPVNSDAIETPRKNKSKVKLRLDTEVFTSQLSSSPSVLQFHDTLPYLVVCDKTNIR